MNILSLSVDLKGFHHELRTPLTGILGMVTFLSESNLTQEQREQVEAILSCANRLANFVNNVITKGQVKEINSYNPKIFQKSEYALVLVCAEDASNKSEMRLSK